MCLDIEIGEERNGDGEKKKSVLWQYALVETCVGCFKEKENRKEVLRV